MATEYRPIASQFRSDDYQFYLLSRQGDVALFAKHKGLHVVSFEIVRIQKREAHEAFGKHFDACEAMPVSEDWGTYGWTHPHWDKAWELFDKKVAKFGFTEQPRLVWKHADIFRDIEKLHHPGVGFDEDEWTQRRTRMQSVSPDHPMLPA